MSGLNKVILLGNLGQDADLRMTGNGDPILKFSVATSETWKDGHGRKQEKTTWHRCILWGKRASGLASYLNKGTKVLIEGKIQNSSYEKDGQTHYVSEINVQNLVFAGGAKGEGGGGNRRSRGSRSDEEASDTNGGGGGGAYNDADYGPSDDDDDIPF